MYLRLWWKDARQFWPIWAFLILAAGALQGLLLHFGERDVKTFGSLGFAALCWASLYACAVGSAAFAGERETGTLRFLDTLPAPRRVVWAGKVSFAVVTTAGLTAALLLIAALGSDDWDWPKREIYAYRDVFPLIGILLQAVALGLFFSSFMNSALLAAISATGLTAVNWTILTTVLSRNVGQLDFDPAELFNWQLKTVLAAVVASWIAFTWGRRNRLTPFQVRFRPPIEVTWRASSRARRERPPARVQPASTIKVRDPLPVPNRASQLSARAWATGQERPRSRFAELRHLMWETMYEGRFTWYLLLAIGLIYPMALVAFANLRDLTFAIPVNAVVALVAGISAFGTENRGRTQRFLMHHGARPGLVWLAKMLAWGLGLAIIWVPLILAHTDTRGMSPESRDEMVWIGLCLPTAFAVGQLCGMAIPRGITAGVVALVTSLGLGYAQVEMVRSMMLPIWGLAAMPLALLAVTWAWSGDWLLERPAPGRYVRLGSLLLAVVGTLLGGYAGVRIWGIPDAGPIAEPSTWITTAILPPDRNAAELYREAEAKLRASRPAGNIVIRDRLPVAVDLIRQAAARPDCRFTSTAGLNLATAVSLPPMRDLADLMTDDAHDRIREKNLAGAWDDIVVLFRMARHVSEGATLTHGRTALEIEKDALDLAIDWATAPGQTPERLRGAIAAYRDWPGPVSAAEVARAEAILFDRTIDLPIDDLKGLLIQTIIPSKQLSAGQVPVSKALEIALITTPWERARAQRVNRRYAAAHVRRAALEPLQSWSSLSPGDPVLNDLESTPLAKQLAPNFDAYRLLEDYNAVARRALVQVMAIRAWQLEHDGRFPDRLEQLVPGELPSLPVDPFSGRPFGYVAYDSNQASVDRALWYEQKTRSRPILPGTRVLTSVGFNREKEVGEANALTRTIDDIAFLIPPLRTPPPPARPSEHSPGAPAGEGQPD
jgi:hypothetical protein